MGAYLREWLGNDLYVIGFEFSSGAFRSRSVSGIRDYDLPPASADYYAADLARLAAPMVFLDFARASRVPVLAAWLDAPRRSHDIDERFSMSPASSSAGTRRTIHGQRSTTGGLRA